METGGSGEIDEGHDRRDFGSGKGVSMTGICQTWRK